MLYNTAMGQQVHYDDVIMTTVASQITSLTVVYSTIYSDADQRKHQSCASLAFVWGIHRDRWIPRTKGQLRGKCFHLMTSSCVHLTDFTSARMTPLYSRKKAKWGVSIWCQAVHCLVLNIHLFCPQHLSVNWGWGVTALISIDFCGQETSNRKGFYCDINLLNFTREQNRCLMVNETPAFQGEWLSYYLHNGQRQIN